MGSATDDAKRRGKAKPAGKKAAAKGAAKATSATQRSTSSVGKPASKPPRNKNDASAPADQGEDRTESAGDESSPWGIPFGFGGPPPDFGDLGEFIRNQREMAKLSVRRLAELANVSNPYLSQVERGLRKPSADILQQVANALRISVESLYVRAGILPPDAERAVWTVPEAIDHDPRLTADQKAALRSVYDSFVSD